MPGQDLGECATPEAVIDVLRDAAGRFAQAFRARGAGLPLLVVAAVLESAACQLERNLERYCGRTPQPRS